MKCDDCIHNRLQGCEMLDCYQNPDNEKYALVVMTNTFTNRFVDRKERYDERKEMASIEHIDF